MANEISISAVTGLAPLVQLYSGVTPIGSPIPTAEIGTTGEYVGDMPSVAYGRYIAVAYVGVDTKIAAGEILWEGSYELMDALGTIRGLNPAAPWTITPTSEKAGNVDLVLSGDGVNESIVTAT